MQSPLPLQQAKAPVSVLRLTNSLDELPRLLSWLKNLAEGPGLPPERLLSLNLALEEWVVNIISHAHDDDGAHDIELRAWLGHDCLLFEIEDDGRPFDPTARAAPDLDKPLAERPIGGLGIHLIRKACEKMSHRRVGDRNILTLLIRIAASHTAPT